MSQPVNKHWESAAEIHRNFFGINGRAATDLMMLVATVALALHECAATTTAINENEDDKTPDELQAMMDEFFASTMSRVINLASGVATAAGISEKVFGELVAASREITNKSLDGINDEDSR